MNNIKTIRVYNLVDSKGNKLVLELGIIAGKRDDVPFQPADKGYRWRFIGKYIPMPVRSRCWFNGFEESIMLDWLNGNGWYPRTRVDMCNGSAIVYELPNGNEGSVTVAVAVPNEFYKEAFDNAIRDLVKENKRITAVRVYRYAHGGSLQDATNAVREICGSIWY